MFITDTEHEYEKLFNTVSVNIVNKEWKKICLYTHCQLVFVRFFFMETCLNIRFIPQWNICSLTNQRQMFLFKNQAGKQNKKEIKRWMKNVNVNCFELEL